MQKIRNTPTAGPSDQEVNASVPAEIRRNKISPTTKYRANCSRVSRAMARKRLPIPASGNSRAICSGVSIFNWSIECNLDLHPLVRKTQAALEQAGRVAEYQQPERLEVADALRPAGTQPALPADCR